MFKLKKCVLKNGSIFIFALLLFIYVCFGLYNTYFCNAVTDICWDVVYSIDSGEKFWCLYLNQGFLSARHPIAHLLICPIILIFKLFIQNPKLIVIVLQSIVQCCVYYFIYKIVLTLTKKRKEALLWGLIFGFSYTALLFATFPEIYVWAGFTQILMLYYVINFCQKQNQTINIKNILLLAVLMVICYGINKINIVSSLILIIFLLSKVYKKNIIKSVKVFLKILFFAFFFFILAVNIQKSVFSNYLYQNKDIHLDFKYNIEKIMDTEIGSLIEPFYALKSDYSIWKTKLHTRAGEDAFISRWQRVQNQNPVQYIPAFLLIVFPICFYIKNKRKFKNRTFINTLFLYIAVYIFFNYIHCSYECALFALNYFPALIILLGILYNEIKLKYKYRMLILFLIFEIVVNIYNLLEIHNFLDNLFV